MCKCMDANILLCNCQEHKHTHNGICSVDRIQLATGGVPCVFTSIACPV